MDQLEGKNIVVAGGTGRVGEGLVRSFLSEGAQVIVPVRSTSKEQRLRSYVEGIETGRLICLPTHIGEEGSIQAFRNRVLEEYERVDMAVACLGGWYYGYPLHRMPYGDWQMILHDNLNTHFLFMKNFLSILHDQNDGQFVMINGSPSEMIIPEEGATSIVAAAQAMMSRALAEEAKTTHVRVYSVTVYNPVRTRDRGQTVMPDWPTAEDLGTISSSSSQARRRISSRRFTRSIRSTTSERRHPRTVPQ
ncbi:MAG: SDR family oxidoreductase [Spirochaetaceae bacterium]|nr:MAG: SDR family oxidoreductase [Spirochaetaceae bacterium]